MIEDELFDVIDAALRPLGARTEPGEEFVEPPLDILRFDVRPVRLHWVPWLGRAASVVAVVRQPVDVELTTGGYPRLLKRIAMAANGRFPPWPHGPALGLTAVVLTAEPIAPGEDAVLEATLKGPSRARAVPLGLIRLNLAQEVMAFTLAAGPEGLFPEPVALADAFTERFRRFVGLLP